MKLIAFAASSSKQSINKKLVSYAAEKAKTINSELVSEVLDLNQFEVPLFSVDKEQQIGSPELAGLFLKKIQQADLIIISFAEHNGSYTAAYKNIFDWCSRIEPKVYQNKAILALSTSPGKGGANSVLTSAVNSLPHFGANLIGNLSIPSFNENFDIENDKLNDLGLDKKLEKLLQQLLD